MEKRNCLKSLNPLSSCRKYNVGLWQCPQFLFLIMGVIIIGAIITTYIIASMKIGDPFLVTLLVIVIASILLVISFIITSSFERIADASKMKTEFISIISHQLRAPLTNLKFSLDFLNSSKLTTSQEDRKEYYAILKENTERMGDLIDNLLTVSRIEAGTFPLRKEKVCLETTIRSLIKKFKPFIKASNVQVFFKEGKNIPNITGDRLWVEQVIENLLDNAIKYTQGEGKIFIEIKRKKHNVLFKIKDTGVGIPKKEQKFIFGKFFRSENALKKQTEGTGLGLHIVKKVVTMSKGKIWFKSKEGKGTVFYFTLPFKNKRV